MTKEEILAKSREECKITDYAELEYKKNAGTSCILAGTVLCLIFFILKIILGLGMDYSYYAIIASANAVINTYLFLRTKNKKYLPMAVTWGLNAILSTIAAIGIIIRVSAIL